MKIIMHIDVNSAFLSWTSVENIKTGRGPDLRSVPSIIGGDSATRHGIVVAKSIPAKKYGIKTADTVVSAFQKCPDLVMAPPDHGLYTQYSRKMMQYIRSYTDMLEQASIDECYIQLELSSRNEALEIARKIKDGIRDNFGFTVNIGISDKKVLAKTASDFEKPDKIHTLFSEEIHDKMWPLPIETLFMAGKSSSEKLRGLGIRTIGDLANSNPVIIESHLKSHGRMLYDFANGIDNRNVNPVREEPKGIGNSETTSQDICTIEEASPLIKRLSASVARRMAKSEYLAGTIVLEIKFSDFTKCSRQIPCSPAVKSASEIEKTAISLCQEVMEQNPNRGIRLIGIRAVKLLKKEELPPEQLSLSDLIKPSYQKYQKLRKTLDMIRDKYGDRAIHKGEIPHSDSGNHNP